MRTWMKLIPAVLLAVPFTGSPLRAETETTEQKIKKLQDEVAQLRKDLESLSDEVKKSNARGAQLAEDLREIKNLLQQPATPPRSVAEDLQEIKSILRDLANRQAAVPRQAGYDPRSLAPSAASTTGTINVFNNYSAAATVRINDRSFRVAPGQNLVVSNVPTGMFQYSVDVDGYGTVEPPRTDTLQSVGYRITIYPKTP